jgi:chemotaxis-related protein WspD
VNASHVQANAPIAPDRQSPPRTVDGQAPEIDACWNTIGVHGNASCPELQKFIRCRNCPVYANATVRLLDLPLPPEYRRERTEHFAQVRHPLPSRKTSAVLFRIQAEWFALPTKAFQEIAERRPIHSLPHRRQGIVLGLVNIRGELLICVSLERLLGMAEIPALEDPPESPERLLVAEWDGSRLVFLVSEVRGVRRFEMHELKEPPASVAHSSMSLTQGVLQWQNKSIGLLDPNLLFSSVHRSLT